MTSAEPGWVLWSGTIGLERDAATCLDTAREAGYRRVSLSTTALSALEEPTAIGRAARRAGIDIIVDPVMGWYSADAVPGAYALPLDDVLRLAEAVGAVALSALGPFTADDASTARLVEAFAALCDRAAEIGADVQLEFMPITALADVGAAWAVVGPADRRNGGIVVDTWHFFRGGSNLDALSLIPPDRIFSVQVADAPAAPRGDVLEETFERMLPGTGGLDLVPLLATLDRTGALRWVGPEVISSATAAMEPVDAARLSLDHLRDVLRQIGHAGRPSP